MSKVYNCCCGSCNSCTNGRCTTLCPSAIATQLLIQNQRRVSSSLYTMNLGATSVTGPHSNNGGLFVNWNQSSDRLRPSGSTVNNIVVVPSRGNSTRSSITRLRPGSMKPGGKGVDIKHNSYSRYLARRKAQCLKTQIKSQSVHSEYQTGAVANGVCPKQGNKTKKYGLMGYAGFGSCETNKIFCEN
jgi:hypothetical protein